MVLAGTDLDRHYTPRLILRRVGSDSALITARAYSVSPWQKEHVLTPSGLFLSTGRQIYHPRTRRQYSVAAAPDLGPPYTGDLNGVSVKETLTWSQP